MNVQKRYIKINNHVAIPSYYTLPNSKDLTPEICESEMVILELYTPS